MIDPRTHRITQIAGEPFDPSRDYAVALVRNFLVGLDHIEPLVRVAKEHPERVPEAGSGRDIKHVLIESFARDLYKRLPGFDVIDTNHDGRVSEEELQAAIAEVTHEAPSHVVADLMMDALDANHDHSVSRDEADAVLKKQAKT